MKNGLVDAIKKRLAESNAAAKNVTKSAAPSTSKTILVAFSKAEVSVGRRILIHSNRVI